MSQIKTGNKGFVNPVDGKVYHIDQVPVGEDGINTPENLSPIDPGDINVDNTLKDIGKKTKITLGTYLSELTKGKVGSSIGVSNKYSIDPTTENTEDFKISDEKGYPQQIIPTQNSEKFIDNLPNQLSENYPEIKGSFKKGKSDGSVPDGHTFISGVEDDNSPIKGYVSKAVGTNEFNPDSKFLLSEIDITNPSPNFEPTINDVNELGKYKGQQGEIVEKDAITLEELRQKASETTSENKFPIDSTNESLSSLTDPTTGYPSPFNVSSQNVDAQTQNEIFYAKREEIRPLSNDPSIKSENFNKGKGPAPFDGHNLLKNVEGNLNASDQNAKYFKYSSGQLDQGGSSVQNDSFGITNETAGIEDKNPLSGYVGGRGQALQSIALNGRWAPGLLTSREFNKKLKLPDGTEASQLKMAQVGHMLTLRAAGELPAVVSNPNLPIDPTGNLSDALSALPSITQIGGKINTSLLSAKDAFDSLSEDEFQPEQLTNIAPFDGQTWGTLTSPAEQFDDASSGGLILTLIALVTAIGSLFTLLSQGISQTRNVSNINDKYMFGKSKFAEINNSTEKTLKMFTDDMFGIKRTKNPFDEALITGMLWFFFGENPEVSRNLRTPAKSLGTFLASNSLDTLAGNGTSVGANLVVCRTIIRSGILLAQYGEKIGRSPNIIAGVKATLGIVRAVSNSKLILGLNTFAKLGDSIIEQANQQTAPVTVLLEDGKTHTTFTRADRQSSQEDPIHTNVKKSRLSYGNQSGANKNLTLSWSTKRAPSVYLVPNSIANLQSADSSADLDSFKGMFGLKHPTKNDPFQEVKIYHERSNKNRISEDTRKKIEAALEAEYVPFYFHDIRTNEIISFHAFLTSLEDSYSASYESVDGFGRVEPVKIYKNTVRRIGLSFIVAATSDDDFDHMWAKINKLLTMIYPQYTSGRDLVGKDFQFKAPFSQMIGATPLIRIRLGDLFRSNYSRFALARLFGMAGGTALLPPSKLQKQNSGGTEINFDASIQEKEKENIERIELRKKQIIQDFKEVNESFIGKKVTKITIIKEDKNPFLPSDNFVQQEVQIKEISKDDKYILEDGTAFTTEYNLVDSEIDEILKKEGLVSRSQANFQTQYGELKDFLNPNGNAIVRSFESAAGKGLAGVIESMNFDWYNQTTWQTAVDGKDANSIAPKMCKITISFAPIHDISPGIDDQGYNRAPVYPVGRAMAPAKFK